MEWLKSVIDAGRKRLRTPFAVIWVGVLGVFALVIAMLWFPNAGDLPVVKAAFAVCMTLMLVGVFLVITSDFLKPKRKRFDAGQDMYSMIDRMVDDLDDDEAAYLQRRLHQRETKTKRDLEASLGDLLDKRAEQKHSRRE